MKKPRIPPLVLVTCVFAAFTLGLFLGRQQDREPVGIRTLPEPTVLQTLAPTQAQPEFPININTADTQALQALPGIGPVLAQRILDYRAEHGPFQSPGELALVSGIGESRLEDIWDLITVGG